MGSEVPETPPIFVCLALPGHAGQPCDHAQQTYMFEEEAALLPCFLTGNAADAKHLAERAVRVARAVLES